VLSSSARKKLRALGVNATAALRGTNLNFFRGLFFVCDEDEFDAKGDCLLPPDVVEKEATWLATILGTNRDPPMPKDAIGRLLHRETTIFVIWLHETARGLAIRLAMTLIVLLQSE
jgi:hypothetical protein